ncbi:adenylate cyclase [Candidatus Epulonipiscium fishelsonii]|uniref:Adenylate cyclase n=1 Tax=Candidatus Epulonipiscium fishelsonii TaxID=77094 RepID=A0ACC8XGT9_9FIRM|nr:adenylate cyclase [Epulopiscium sp. SCG-B05WGA-EpuloA1]ONI42897.1 adenylate cyclase [Epulopiscium sp. SCG-B11WGA-EpuloA1]
MYSSIDTLWILIGAVLVFFMQAGFAMVESGFTRAKNAGNIIMKNLMDFAAGTLVFWFIGFGLMFGTSINGLVGTPDFFVQGDYSGTYPTMAFLIFQTVFCATSATIVSGAMAERTKFSSYCIYSVILSGFIYPVSGHWIWGGGWLSQIGFHDFAGSTAVHMVGGVAALIGAKILGPRIGKYDKNGKPKAILGHSLTLGALGVFILWFCWFGFNGASSLGLTGDEAILTVSNIFVTTNISAAAASVITMLITWVKYGKPDVSMTLNGALGGLVAITAGCDIVSPFGAFWIGIIAGFVIVFGIEFVDKVLRIDDPVGAVGVHGMCGAVGTILIGVFSVSDGLMYGGGYETLKVQTLGVLAVAVWVAITMTIVFNVIKAVIGLRVSKDEEIIGLDIEEHGLTTSYADFMPMDAKAVKSIESKVTYIQPEKTSTDMPITKITIITKQSKFEDLKSAMQSIGVTGMTVTQVLGCGIQKGANEYYRGIPVEFNLLPKVKVEIVVSKVPVELVVEAAKDCLRTGNIGDGKIFVYPVIDVVKVRTGERGYSALQDEE